ncbi:hypothetical protein FOPG_16209, partial [Fusarium oxysporum f. sp. conglutinans race 2 54008]
MSPKKLYQWMNTWFQPLLDKLDDEDDGQVVKILFRIVQVE